MSIVKLLYKGYLLGVTKALAGTVVVTLIHIFSFLLINGVQVYLQNWDYPRYIIGAGIIVSFMPAGVVGIFLAFVLWKYKEEGKLNLKRASFVGFIIGSGSTIFLFFLVLASPLGAGFLRLDSWQQIIYFCVPILIGGLIGRWTGIDLSKLMLVE